MKKLSLAILLLLLLSHPFQPLFAQKGNSIATSESTISTSSVTVTPAQDTRVSDYQLPYPGILPDSPFYFLKITRDRIVDFLISDPVKKAAFDILESDKRLSAGMTLLQEHPSKEAMAEETISKAENYAVDALARIKDAKRQGLSADENIQKLILSSKKHVLVLQQLEKQITPKMRSSFQALTKRAMDIAKEAMKLGK